MKIAILYLRKYVSEKFSEFIYKKIDKLVVLN